MKKQKQLAKNKTGLSNFWVRPVFGFTLVELIVVITILAILGTIAIMAFSGYSKNARDSARVSDLTNMKKVLELWILQSGNYPEPTNGTWVTFSGSYTLWNQWTFWESVFKTVWKLEKKPVDPLYDTEYTYSVTNSKKEYELWAVLEWTLAYENPLIWQTYAATEAKQAYVSWNYNGVLTTINSSPAYVIALPSIILSSLINKNLDSITPISLVYHKMWNLPSSYQEKNLTMTKSELDFTPQVVWTGTWITSLNNQTEFQNLVISLQSVYNSGSLFAALPEYKSIATETWLTSTVLWSVKSIIETNISQELKNVTNIPANSCAANPWYVNAIYNSTLPLPTQFNQAWQNTNASNPCYYVCNNWYIWNDCGTQIVCNDGESIVNNACSDPYKSNVSLLIHFDGDLSYTWATWITFWEHWYSGVIVPWWKFWSAVTQRLNIYNHTSLVFWSWDYTIDFWIKSNNQNKCPIWAFNWWTPINQICFNGNVLEYTFRIWWVTYTISSSSDGLNYKDNNWHYLSVQRSSWTVYFYIDGILKWTQSVSGSMENIWQRFIINWNSNDSSFDFVWLVDEYRVTKWVARHNWNFTLPVQPFAY